MTVKKCQQKTYQQDKRHQCLVVYNKAHQEKQAALFREIKSLFDSKKGKSKAERSTIDRQVDSKVRAYNQWSNRRLVYDLHWMTVGGAIDYVEDVLGMVNCHEKVQFITGRGKHSLNNVPRIKSALEAMFWRRKDLLVEDDPCNPGVLYFTRLY